MLRQCWIKPDGEMIPCPNWGDHVREAYAVLGDEVDGEVETYACSIGWLKVFKVDGEIIFCGPSLTNEQRDTVERFGHIADEVEIEASSHWRYLRSAGRQ